MPIIIILLVLGSITCSAQERHTYLGVGTTSVLDTYLSPEHYHGIEVRILNEKTNENKSDNGWAHTWTQQAFVSNAKPRSECASMLSGIYSLTYSLHRNLHPCYGMQIAVGGEAEVFGGGIYNTRNGNNPAQMKAGIGIGPEMRLRYEFTPWHKPYRLHYRIAMPFIGAQFSPAYGQSYYELFARGNYDHNICLATPFNALSLHNMLTLDIPIGQKTVSIGYMGDFRQSRLNSLSHHIFTHGFVIGYEY